MHSSSGRGWYTVNDMDPVVHKLLELWELDDSALSNHSDLQSSNALSINKHLSLYSEKPEEPFYHADSPLKDCCQNQSEIVWPESSAAELPAVVLFCEKCRHANQEHANWCVECGTAMLRTKTDALPRVSTHSEGHEHVQSDDDLADLNMVELIFTESRTPSLLDGVENQDSTSVTKFDSLSSPDEHRLNYHDSSNHQMCADTSGLAFGNTKEIRSLPKSPKRSDTSPAMSKTHPNKRMKKFCNTTISKHTSTSQLVTRQEYQRHWNTSGTYMWRKPSSIQKSSSYLTNDVHHDNQTQLGDLYTPSPGYENPTLTSTLPRTKLTTNRVPVLNLDAIDDNSLISTSAYTSIRLSSSINDVRQLG